MENKPGSTALSSEGLKSTALNHTALIVLAVLFLYKMFCVQQHPSLLNNYLSLILEIEERTDVLNKPLDLDLVIDYMVYPECKSKNTTKTF